MFASKQPLDASLSPEEAEAPPVKAASPARAGFFAAARRLLRISAFAALALFAGLLLYDTLAPPISTLMLARWASGREARRDFAPLAKISPFLTQAVIVSEDARFCLHAGVDWRAMRSVAASAQEGAPTRGASTIDMQTVKNLFLWPGRSYLRKLIEIPLTLGLDLIWSKSRILEAYLNIAEWGDGIFGAEAASRLYFHKSAAALTPREAALLAAALPNPKKRDPRSPRTAYARLAGKVLARMRPSAAPISCLGRAEGR